MIYVLYESLLHIAEEIDEDIPDNALFSLGVYKLETFILSARSGDEVHLIKLKKPKESNLSNEDWVDKTERMIMDFMGHYELRIKTGVYWSPDLVLLPGVYFDPDKELQSPLFADLYGK